LKIYPLKNVSKLKVVGDTGVAVIMPTIKLLKRLCPLIKTPYKQPSEL
jgi:hypothetical protein